MPGAERFVVLNRMYLRDTNAALIVYDVDSTESLKQVLKSRKWENPLKISISKWEGRDTRQADKWPQNWVSRRDLGFKCPNVNGLDERWKEGMYDSKLTPYLR